MAKRLFQALQNSNRIRIPPQDRLRIAELFARPIAYAISTQERKFIDTSFPLSDKAHLTIRLCIRLNEELAFACKIAAHDVAMDTIGDPEQKTMIVALFLAVRHLAQAIYLSALVYQPAPRHAWRELHNLFAFAETNQWSTTRVKSPGIGESEATTLRDLYLRILLFAAANPYRIRQREMRALYFVLPRWAPKVKFGTAAGSFSAETRFIAQLKQDHPALHIGLLKTLPEKPALEFSTEPLIQSLRERCDELPPDTESAQPGAKSEGPSKETLEYLIRIWGSKPKYRSERTQLNFDLNFVVGLPRIYSLVSGEAQPQEGTPENSGISREDDQDTASTFSPDLVDKDSGPALIPMQSTNTVFVYGDGHSGMFTEDQYTPSPPIWQQKKGRAPASSTTVTLQTLNESAGGHCVNWSGRDIPGIKLGELVGIQAPDNPSNYGLAVARWMRHHPGQGLELGLQLIAPHVCAVTVTAAERRKCTPTQCLLVPELKSAHRPASLVLPVLPFKVGLNLRILHLEEERKVRLVRLLDSTGAFAQYQYEYEYEQA